MLPRPQHFKDIREWAQRLVEHMERTNQVRWLAERFEQGANLTFTYNPSKNTIPITGNATGTDLSYTASTRLLESSTGADVTLPLVTTGDAGLAPASGGGTGNFLRADGTWAVPLGVTNLNYTASTRLLESSTGADVTLPLVTSTDAGLAPASGGGTVNFLRADGSWAKEPLRGTLWWPPVLTNSEIIFRMEAQETLTIAANMSNWSVISKIAATASTTIDVKNGATVIGTAVFAASGTVATLTTTGGTSKTLNAGDVLEIVGPATADTTLAQMSWYMQFAR